MRLLFVALWVAALALLAWGVWFLWARYGWQTAVAVAVVGGALGSGASHT